MKKGSHHTEAHKKRVSLLLIGRVRSKAHCKKLSISLTGKTLPIEVREKIRQSLTGRVGHPNFWKGKKLSQETRQKMSITRTGRPGTKGRTGIPHTVETRLKISESHRGSKCYLWQGGITPINIAIRGSLKYKLWREAVFKRDGYTCVIGGKNHGNRLNADHIKSFSAFPKLRFKVSNGRTLCVECHKKTPNFGYKGSKIYAR